MSSQKKVEVVIKISEELYNDLKKQLELLKQSNVAKFKDIHTVDDLVSEFLQNLTTAKDDFETMQRKMFTVFADLDNKQQIIKEIFNAFAKEWEGFKPSTDKKKKDDDEELFDDLDAEDDEDENKKNKKKAKGDKEKKN